MSSTVDAQHAASRPCYLRGCRLPGCCAANAHYLKRYRFRRARKGTVRTDVGPVADHVRSLSADGWSHRQIAAAAECSRRQVCAIIAGEYPTIDGALAERILATTLNIHACPPATYVDATGTIRRTQALIASGYALVWIAGQAGMSPAALGRIVNHGHSQLTASRAQGISDVYALWKDLPGDNTRARLRGAAEGWRTPDYWDDTGRIDDAGFDPDARQLRVEQIAEDGRFLLAAGLDSNQTAERLGITRDYLTKALRECPEAAEAAVAA